jgi:FOG: FHA domain
MVDKHVAADGDVAWLLHVIAAHLPLRIAEVLLEREKPLVIGRQPGLVDLVVNEGSVSRRHACIRYIHDHFELCDLESLNGTFLNGLRLAPQRQYALKEHDEIRYGNSVTFRFLLRVQSVQEQPVAAAPVTVAASDDPFTNADDGADDVRTLPRLPVAPAAARAAQGMAQLLPPAIVNALSQQPALIVLPAASTQGQPLSPTVRVLQPDATVSIGRVTDNDIVLADRVVSRQHAEVFATPGGFSIRDLGSSNGIIVNQSKITQPYLLTHGDHITLGTTIIVFVDLQAGSEPTAMLHTVPSTSSLSPGDACSQAAPTSTKPAHVVICPCCGVANTVVARFCASCSAPLHVS